MKDVGLLYHPKVEASAELAERLQNELVERGLTPWVISSWEEEAITERIPHLDCLITLGGDGTILRAARMAASQDIAILGINFGRLGFLAEVQPDEAQAALIRLLNGDYRIEERMMLNIQAHRDGSSLGEFEALNDATVGRGAMARAVRLTTSVDGERVIRYVADGLIVSTPTGSTAYSLAAGGPVLTPGLHNLLITPIAPYLSLINCLVVPGDVTVSVDIDSDYDATLTVDGHIDLELKNDDRVTVQASDNIASFIRFGSEARFYNTLEERLR